MVLKTVFFFLWQTKMSSCTNHRETYATILFINKTSNKWNLQSKQGSKVGKNVLNISVKLNRFIKWVTFMRFSVLFLPKRSSYNFQKILDPKILSGWCGAARQGFRTLSRSTKLFLTLKFVTLFILLIRVRKRQRRRYRRQCSRPTRCRKSKKTNDKLRRDSIYRKTENSPGYHP